MTPGAMPRLALHGITKRYASVIANDGVELTVAGGQIHGLVGENGAGKSTLMRIVYGVTQPDSGILEWEGRTTVIRSPAAARRLGIGMVFQNFSLFATLTVGENIALALENRVAARELEARINEVSRRYGLPIDPRRLMHGLSAGERQRVEIVRCLLQSPRLLVLDEPTSVLTPHAVRALFGTLRTLAEEGVSILYSSHKLHEIRALCDVATVLRNGRVSGTVIPGRETNATLARMMIGRELPACRRQAHEPGVILLEVNEVSLAASEPFATALHRVNLQVCAGEIVGIAGVSGNGQQSLLEIISGALACARCADVRLCGREAGLLNAAQRRQLGLRFIPEERLGCGAVPAMHLADNSVLTDPGLVRHGLVRTRAARTAARETIAQFAVQCAGELAAAQSLSGGNLQKFIVGREIRLAPRVLLAAQPTWGVDVGAAVLIHQALIDLRDAGAAVLVVSEDLDELFSICDRLAVLAQGRLSVALPVAQLTPEIIGEWLTGAFAAAPRSAGRCHVAG